MVSQSKELGDAEHSDSYIGETGNGACSICSSIERFVHRFAAFFHSIGFNIEKFFKMELIQGFHNDVSKDASSSLDQSHAAKTNACEFSYCIDPPRAVRMHSWTTEAGLTKEQIESRTRRFCAAHQSFLKSAQSAKNPSAGQTYCMQFHKDDDCKNVCSKYWNAVEPSRAVTRNVLEKLDSRLDTIDDTQLQLSDDEFLRMLQLKTQSR